MAREMTSWVQIRLDRPRQHAARTDTYPGIVFSSHSEDQLRTGFLGPCHETAALIDQLGSLWPSPRSEHQRKSCDLCALQACDHRAWRAELLSHPYCAPQLRSLYSLRMEAVPGTSAT